MAQDTRAVAKENGKSTFFVDIEVGGYALQGDEPKGMGGEDYGPAPFDLLTAALAECTAMTVRWYARNKKISLGRVWVEVVHKAQTGTTATSGAAHFEKVVFLEGDALTEDNRHKLKEIAAKCPIQKFLEMPCVVDTSLGA